MGKKAELEAREVFGNPDNPLNPEVLQQRARELQEGFEEQIKSASGGMLDLGDWRRSLEEGLTAGAAIDWLKDRNTELENIGVPGASDRKWVVDQLDALARLTGNGPKSSSIDIDGPGAADVPQEIDISFDEEVEETTTNSEIKIDEEPPAPDVQTIDIGAVPAQQLHAEESSSPSLATAAVVGAGAGFGMTIGAIAAMMLLRRRDAAGGRRELEPPRSGASVMVSGESTAVELAFSK